MFEANAVLLFACNYILTTDKLATLYNISSKKIAIYSNHKMHSEICLNFVMSYLEIIILNFFFFFLL